MLFVLSILLVLLVVSNGLVRSKRSGLRHAVVHLATLPGMDKDGRRGIIKQASLFPEVLDMDRLDEVLYELKDLYPSQFQKFASLFMTILGSFQRPNYSYWLALASALRTIWVISWQAQVGMPELRLLCYYPNLLQWHQCLFCSSRHWFCHS